MSQKIDSACDRCERIADWRAIGQDSQQIYAAACKTHKDEVRAALYRRFGITK